MLYLRPMDRLLRLTFLFLFISYPSPIFAQSSFTHFHSEATKDPCKFTAKVIPIEQTERAKAIYKDVCAWFTQTFKAVPDPKIPLNDVKFIKSWDDIEYIKYPESLYGVYYANHIRDTNEVLIFDESQPNDYWVDSQLTRDSILAHEFVHYLMKSSRWNNLKKVNGMNHAILEAHAYWCQDQFVRRQSEGALSLKDLIKEDKRNELEVASYDFVFRASWLYDLAPTRFVYNAVLWVDAAPVRVFEDLVMGRYIYQGQMY